MRWREELGVGPPVVQMPLQGPGGMVGAVLGELRVAVCDDAEAYARMTVEERQQLWNETDGDQCICGTWGVYGTHNGGWAAAATVAGVPGCQNTSVHGSDFCLYCTEEPEQPCDQWGRVLSTQNLHVRPRCGDVWPGMVCPTCRYDSQQSCFRRCRCPCDGCAVGRVWYTPDQAELDTYEPPDTPYDDQGDMEEQAADMDDEWMVYHELLQDQDNFDPTAGESGTGGPTAERDLAGTAMLGLTFSSAWNPVKKTRRRRNPVKKTRRKTATKTTSARSVPSVLCQLMSAQAGHHQLKSVVPATGGKELEHQGDLEQGCETPHTSRLLKPKFRLAEMRPD